MVEQVVTRSQTPDHVSNLRYARKEPVISRNKVYHDGKTDAYNHPPPSHGESMGNEKLRPNRVIPPLTSDPTRLQIIERLRMLFLIEMSPPSYLKRNLIIEHEEVPIISTMAELRTDMIEMRKSTMKKLS